MQVPLERVVARVLPPLQEECHVLKPSLVHGNFWDDNTALDATMGEACLFDACSFCGHNDHDVGNWRTPRHRLSDKAYILYSNTKFPASEPAGDWGARNVLYGLPIDIGNLVSILGSQQREMQVMKGHLLVLALLTRVPSMYDDMTTFCRTFYLDNPKEHEDALIELTERLQE